MKEGSACIVKGLEHFEEKHHVGVICVAATLTMVKFLKIIFNPDDKNVTIWMVSFDGFSNLFLSDDNIGDHHIQLMTRT